MSVAILLLFLVNFVRLLHGKSRNNLDKMLNAYLSNLSLWVSHDGQMGVTTTLAPKDLGPQNPGNWVVRLGQLLLREHVFRTQPPPSPPSLKRSSSNVLIRT